MGTCSQGHELLPAAKFCGTCGESVVRSCLNGHVVPADARFCPICGAAVRAHPGDGTASTLYAPGPSAPAPGAPPSVSATPTTDRNPWLEAAAYTAAWLAIALAAFALTTLIV